MTDSETDSSLSLKVPRFHGRRSDDYTLWRMRLRAACRVKGVWDAVENSTDCSSDTSSQTTHGTQLKLKQEKASGIIISALGDAPLRVIIDADDNPSQMLKLLDARYASNRTVTRIAVQTQLFRMSYNGQNMTEYIDHYSSLFAQLDRMGNDAAIPESHKPTMLLASINPKCSLESTAAALRTKDAKELTWEYVTTTLIDEYNARTLPKFNEPHKSRSGRVYKQSSRSASLNSNVLPGRVTYRSDAESEEDENLNALTVTNKSFKSFRGGSQDKIMCDFCEKSGHVESKCFLNPNNPKNRLTPKMRAVIQSGANNFSANLGQSDPLKKIEFAGVAKGCVSNDRLLHVPESPVREASRNKTAGINVKSLNNTYADSGATTHMFHEEVCFVPGSLKSCSKRIIYLADRTSVTAKSYGEVLLTFEKSVLRLQDVLFVPALKYNLVSVGRLADKGIESQFTSSHLILMLQRNKSIIGTGSRDLSSGMYMLPSPALTNEFALKVNNENGKTLTKLWHRRLAHLNLNDLVNVHKYADDVPILKSDMDICRACRLGKAKKLPFIGHFGRADKVAEIVHSDIVGKLEPSYPHNHRYIGTFIDDYSRYTFVGFLKHKSDIKEAFYQFLYRLPREWYPDIGSSSGQATLTLHSDGAEEYKALQKSITGLSFRQTFSSPYTPEHNAVAERANRTIVEGARAILIQARLPSCLWPFAVKHVLSVRNKVVHSKTNESPHMLMFKTRPSLKNIHVFGCAAFVLQLPRASKFESRAREGVYLETLENGVFKVLLPDSTTGYRFVESRHVTFDETQFPGAPDLKMAMDEEAKDDETFDVDVDSYTSGSENEIEISFDDNRVRFPASFTDENQASHIPNDGNERDEGRQYETVAEPSDASDQIRATEGDSGKQSVCEETILDITQKESSAPSTQRYPHRQRKAPGKWYIASQSLEVHTPEVTTGDEPTVKEAMSATAQERALWEQAIEEELESLDSKDTWILDSDPKSQPLPTHIVLRIKRTSEGSVERFKARIVAGGNHQVYGQNYLETYAPVVSFSTVRTFICIALWRNMCRTQLDIKTAFLNGILKEEIWVRSPRDIPNRPSRCYKLKKAIYGLKQAHLAWHEKLCKDLDSLGFKELVSAPCVFQKDEKSGGVIYLLIYVDDIQVLATSRAGIDFVVDSFRELYEVRVSTDIEWFLGVKFTWKKGTDELHQSVTLSQRLYIDSILRKFGMLDSKPAPSPMTESFWSDIRIEEDKAIVEENLYQKMIGSLLYLALRTRPDILSAVSILSRFQKAPTKYCHTAVKRIMRYLRGTMEFSLMYSREDIILNGFVDSDFAADITDRKSMSGFMILIGNSLCHWMSKKQASSALSTCEAEYYAIAEASKELIWFQSLLTEIGISLTNATVLHSDNQAAIKWAQAEHPPFVRAKHIDVRVHFVRDLVTNGKLEVKYVPSDGNLADILTKPVSPQILRRSMHAINLGVSAAGEC